MADINLLNTASKLSYGSNNQQARVELYGPDGLPLAVTNNSAFASTNGVLPVGGVNDGVFRAIRVDRFGTLRTTSETLLFHDDVEGTTLNTQLWTSTATTMTSGQSATNITLNASAITTINTGIMLVSQKQFFKTPLQPLRHRARVRATLVANQIGEWGFGAPSAVTTAQVANGAFWRITSGGSVQPVLAFNGSDTVTGSNIAGSLSSANYYTYGIICDDDRVIFTCQEASTGTIISQQELRVPASQQRLWSVTHLPCFYRVFNTGSAPASAGQLLFSDTLVCLIDVLTNKPWAHQVAGNAHGGELSPTAYTQTATFANSAAPSNATLSNTAAGYATLGGLFSFAAVAGAATDYCLFGFVVPAPYSFYCTGIHIAGWNTGAAVATTPTLLVWGLGANGASANLSTGGHLRVPVGSQSYAVGAAIGANVPDIEMPLGAPLRTDSGKLFAVILRMPVATATASQVLQGAVTPRGYFE